MKKKLFLIAAILLTMASCTKQSRVRNFGGTETIQVKPGYRVMMATWKDSNLFYMIEPMPENYEPTEKYLVESSSYGIWESEIIFIESR
ncbi:MAG: hypothetical protein J1F67_05080 [Muribaculaceae bacterium]|nr:hypothetical protein [Muribaculaceae bacterium]